MNLNEIENLTVESALYELLYRLVDFSQVPIDEDAFDMFGEGLSRYEQLNVHTSLQKPTLQDFEDELVAYKSELVVEEEARLAEVARVQDIQDRFEALKDVTGALFTAGIVCCNWALERDRIINDNDQIALEAIEAADGVLVSEQLQKQINTVAKRYLDTSDWLIIREVETGVPCPQNVKDARTAARLSIIE